MQSEQLLPLVEQILDDAKAIDAVVLDVRSLTSIADYFVVCSGRSTRHVKSIAENVAEKMKVEHGVRPFGIAGLETGEWALVDLGDIIVHVLLPEARAYYSLEKLWGSTPNADKETTIYS